MTNRRPSFVRRIVLAFATLLVAAALGYAGLACWLHHVALAALPQLDGSTHLAGLGAPVDVRRDPHGVAHLIAASQLDLFRAQGYVTAQDRLFQMDLLRRAAGGNLSEVLGPSTVERDRAARVLLFRRTAQRIYANLPADEQSRFLAYAEGVNQFMAAHRSSLPPEFRLLGYKPQPWTAIDSVSIGLLVVEMLDTHWQTKLAREHVLALLHSDGIAENLDLVHDLYPEGSWRDHPPTGEQHSSGREQQPAAPSGSDSNDDEDEPAQSNLHQPDQAQPGQARPGQTLHSAAAANTLAALHLAVDPASLMATLGLPTCSGCAPGSNNWVVSGRHTQSGLPILANDMHLSLTVPNLWYIADLRAPGYHAAGVTLPGVPYVIEGHNEHIAWGITALMGDAQDLYLERTDGKGNYERNGASWQPLTTYHEVIHVRAGRDQQLTVQLTNHGPLLNPILKKEQRPIALRWTLYDPALNSMPIYRVNTAANWDEFSHALADWCWPTLNFVYSDSLGHIGYQAVGRIPIRASLYHGGNLPLPFDSMNGRTEWGGPVADSATGTLAQLTYVPFSAMPRAYDPPSGFLATANARVTTAQSPYTITQNWADPYRVERIYKTLENRDGLTASEMLALETDVTSEVDQQFAQRLAWALEHTTNRDPRLSQAAVQLRAWDGRLTTDSPAASLVVQTRKALWPMILEPRLGKDYTDYQWLSSNFALEEILMRQKPAWLPSAYKSWDEFLTAAVRKALVDGHAPTDLRHWSYGSWHVVDLEHPLSSMLPLIGRVAATGALPLSGDTTTVKQVGRSFGPSQRFILDWAHIDSSSQNIVLGQSGNPLSPYFRDQWNTWYNGSAFPLAFTEMAVESNTRHRLQLLP